MRCKLRWEEVKNHPSEELAMKVAATFFVFVVSLVLVSPSSADIISVPAAQPTIQAGIDAAFDGDEVVVAPGTYNEVINFLGKAVTLRSSDGADITIIDGTGLNARVVECGSGEGSDTVLDGFTITSGDGGIVCANSSPTILNCVIADNNADTGAGIECYSSSPTIINCTIQNNTANIIGGGVNCNAGSNPTITGCTITGNEAMNGGGMYIVNNSSPLIKQCVISANTVAGSGGGISCAGDKSHPTIEDCVIAGNNAAAGAGINCGNSSPTISNCTVEDNIAAEIAGGINCKDNASPTITNCMIRNNTAVLYNGGGIICNLNSHATITECTITAKELLQNLKVEQR